MNESTDVNSLLEEIKSLKEAIRERDAELLRIRTTQINAAVELEKIRYWLGIIREPDISAETKVRQLVQQSQHEV